jgi:hypothetical protein
MKEVEETSENWSASDQKFHQFHKIEISPTLVNQQYQYCDDCCTAKSPTCSMSIYIFNSSPIKIPRAYFTEIQKSFPKITNSQRNSEQKVQCWRYHNNWSQSVVQFHSNKNREEDQWNRREDSDKKNHTATTKWFLTKQPKIHDGENRASSINVSEKTGYLHVKDWN